MSTKTIAEIVSTRQTFDGVIIHLHADGSVSTRMSFFRGKFAPATMWRAWEDICMYTFEEIPAFMRETKGRR